MLTRKNEDSGVNRITVKIMGDDYTIIGPDSLEYINSLAKLIDEKIKEIQNAHGDAKLTKTQLAVLVALQMTDRYNKLRMEHEKMVKLLQDAK